MTFEILIYVSIMMLVAYMKGYRDGENGKGPNPPLLPLLP